MTVNGSQQSQAFFMRMDKAFWVIWALFPVMIGVIVYTLLNPATFNEGLTPEQIKCMGEKLTLGQGSALTQSAVWFLVAFDIGFYTTIFAILHRMIRRFKAGTIFVGKTLASVQTLGWIIVGYPFATNLLNNGFNFALRSMGQPSVGGLTFYIDLAPIAVGLFLVTLKHVLHHAMQMKFENDLTI